MCICIVLAVFAGDLCLKNRIERQEISGEGREIWGGRLLLRRYHNQGMALGRGRNHPRAVAALSVILTVLVGGALVLALGRNGNSRLRTGLSLLLGGAFSNTYDRLKRKYVVDYISFGVKWKPFRNLVFNLSDFCIITGALLAALGAAR